MSNNRPVLGLLTLMTICVASIISLRGIVLMAEYGFSSTLLYLFVTLTFFIPTALLSAELATGWPQEGGVYVWAREAFGRSTGFFAMWLVWIVRVVSYPVLFSFMAGTLAFAFSPSLADNKIFVFILTLIFCWSIIFINFFGTKISGRLVTWSVIVGTFLPLVFIIALAAFYIFEGQPLHVSFTWHGAFANLEGLSSIALLAGLYLMFTGAEFCALYANDVKNPARDYPRAIFWAAAIIVFMCIFGTLAVAVVVPQSELSLIAGLMQAFKVFLSHYHMQYLIPVMAILTTISLFGAVSNLVYGTSKGLIATAEDGIFPKFFDKHNKHDAPVRLLWAQGIIATLLSLVFIYMPNVNSSYWVVDDAASQLMLIFYVLLFVIWIRLRLKHPEVHRGYIVPGGKPMMYTLSAIGILASIFVFFVSFIPPSQFKTGDPWVFVGSLVVAIVVFCFIPLLVAVVRHYRSQ